MIEIDKSIYDLQKKKQKRNKSRMLVFGFEKSITKIIVGTITAVLGSVFAYFILEYIKNKP